MWGNEQAEEQTAQQKAADSSAQADICISSPYNLLNLLVVGHGLFFHASGSRAALA